LEEKALWPFTTNLKIESSDGTSNAFQGFEDPDGSVKTIAIPELMRKFEFKTIDLLKIDIEVSEKQLFSHKNAKDWLPLVKVILVETHDITLILQAAAQPFETQHRSILFLRVTSMNMSAM